MSNFQAMAQSLHPAFSKKNLDKEKRKAAFMQLAEEARKEAEEQGAMFMPGIMLDELREANIPEKYAAAIVMIADRKDWEQMPEREKEELRETTKQVFLEKEKQIKDPDIASLLGDATIQEHRRDALASMLEFGRNRGMPDNELAGIAVGCGFGAGETQVLLDKNLQNDLSQEYGYWETVFQKVEKGHEAQELEEDEPEIGSFGSTF